jgi:hypothetical protein
MNLLTEIQYFPPATFYKSLSDFSNIIFEQYECFQKMSFRNRMIIANANGRSVLSVPLEHGRDQKKYMKDVRIANHQPWQSQHWKSLESAYGRSPFFEFYRDELYALYEKPFLFLLDWNMHCFEWTLKKLGLHLQVGLTHSYSKDYDPGNFLDRRNALLPKNYLDFEGPKYRQVFEDKLGFLSNLSILDLIFCEGKRGAELLV